MVRVLCFTDDGRAIAAIQQVLQERQHEALFLSASSLSEAVREQIRAFAADIILLELTAALDNPHLYIFLRADSRTRSIPVVLLSNTMRVHQQAEILRADGIMLRPLIHEQLPKAISHYTTAQLSLTVAA